MNLVIESQKWTLEKIWNSFYCQITSVTWLVINTQCAQVTDIRQTSKRVASFDPCCMGKQVSPIISQERVHISIEMSQWPCIATLTPRMGS